jgi:hypothetical protein
MTEPTIAPTPEPSTDSTPEAALVEDVPSTEDAAEPNPAPARYRDLPPVSERDLAARARGLSSAYIDGGDDPDLAETRRKEAVYRRLLIAMIVAIVGLGLIVTIVGFFVPGVG